MGIIAWIVLGLGAGLLANMLIPGRRSQGLVLTCVIGVAGALLGGWLATKLFHVVTLHGFFNLSTWLTAIVRRGGPAAGLSPGHQPGKHWAHPAPDRLGAPVNRAESSPRAPDEGSPEALARAGPVYGPTRVPLAAERRVRCRTSE